MGICFSGLFPAETASTQHRDRTNSPDPTLLEANRRQGRDWGATGGKRLGGVADQVPVEGAAGVETLPSAASLRRKAAEAAERRQVNASGISKDRAVELRERQQKDELLGKLEEHYARKKLEMPIGLKAASVEKLKNHWETVRNNNYH
jgi:hypothetical protein